MNSVDTTPPMRVSQVAPMPNGTVEFRFGGGGVRREVREPSLWRRDRVDKPSRMPNGDPCATMLWGDEES